MRRLIGSGGGALALGLLMLVMVGCGFAPAEGASSASQGETVSPLQVAPAPLCPGPDCPMGPEFTPPPDGGGAPPPLCPGPDCPMGPDFVPPPGGMAPPSDGWVGPCAEGGALYGTPYCDGVRSGTTVGPCDEGGAYVDDPSICPFGPGGNNAPATGTPVPTATPTPTTIPTPTGTPSGVIGPCAEGGALAGSSYCARVRDGLEIGPCAVGGAYVDDPVICPVGPATGVAKPTPTATPATPPVSPTASVTPTARAVIPTPTPTGAPSVTGGPVAGILPPPDLMSQCPGATCPWGPEWAPPCGVGGPLEGTPECTATLAGTSIGPCAPGGSAYGDVTICPWTAGVAAELAGAGGFFGTASQTPEAAASAEKLIAGAEASLSATFAPASLSGRPGAFASLGEGMPDVRVYAPGEASPAPALTDPGDLTPFRAPAPPPEGLFGVTLPPQPASDTIVPSGQAIAGGSSGADEDTVPRVVERLAALVGGLRLPAR